MNREEAIKKAEEFNLENEVKCCIDHYSLTPEEALREWDID